MNLSESTDFLLKNAGPVIQYRLRKEILKNITQDEEKYWLEQIYQTPYFKLVESYTLQSMLGYGDDEYARGFQDISLRAFGSLLPLSSLDQILNYRESKKKYNYPYIETDTYFPCSYHLTTLAHTYEWRTPDNVKLMASAINHMDDIFTGDYRNGIVSDFVLKNGKGPLWSLSKPFERFSVNYSGSLFRRFLTEIAMLGVGREAEVIRESAEAVEEALSGDGILRFNYASDKLRKKTKYAYAYGEIGLEPDHKKKMALDCDLTFWAVQFLHFAISP
jgi:hypothetical protein